MSDFEDFLKETEDRPAFPQRRYGLTFNSINPCPLNWQLSQLIPIPVNYPSDAKVVQACVTVTELQEACVRALNLLSEETRYMADRLRELDEQVKRNPTAMVRTAWVVAK